MSNYPGSWRRARPPERRGALYRIQALLAVLLIGVLVPAQAIGAQASTRATTASTTGYPDYGCTAGSGTQVPERHCGGYFKASTDGVNLAWQAYLPDPAVWGPGPYPTILDYSGYEPATTFFDGILSTFLSQGYAMAGVNVRGTGCSGGSYNYFEPKEWKDGYDSVEFLAHQPWSNGAVAMAGKSYPGITPLYVAATDPPNLRAIVPGAFFADLYRDVAYPGGVENAVFAAGFGLASQPANQFGQQSGGVVSGDPTCIADQAQHATNPVTNPFVLATGHPYDGAIYHERSPIYFASQVHVPVFAELAWQDEELAANAIDYVTQLPSTTPWRATLLNGDHGEYYSPAVLAQIYRFLSFYLKRTVPSGDPCAGAGDGSYAVALACYQAEPRVTVLGDVGPTRLPTYVRQFASWPVTQTVDRFNLGTGGVLDHAAPTAGEAPTTYTYLPGVGTNSYGTLKGFQGQSPVNEDFWQTRPPAGSVATFTTAPFTHDTFYAGTGSLDLWLSSTAADTDLEVMVTELRPDGHGGWLEQYVQKGWLRASHRLLDPTRSTPLRPYQTHLLTDAQPLVPGAPTFMRVEIFPFSQLFRAGRMLRITVEAPSVAPEIWGFAALPTPAQNTIYTDSAHPSSVALPLVPLTAATDVFPPEADCTADNNQGITNQPCRPVLLAGSSSPVDFRGATRRASAPGRADHTRLAGTPPLMVGAAKGVPARGGPHEPGHLPSTGRH
ncbi:MAG: CocE/NonD family hydrolase [Acidimicrobiales bacterium]